MNNAIDQIKTLGLTDRRWAAFVERHNAMFEAIKELVERVEQLETKNLKEERKRAENE